MDTNAVLDIGFDALVLDAKLAAPVLVTALVVGFAISLRSLADVAVPIAWAVAAVFAGRAIIVYGFLGALRLLRRRRSNDRRGTADTPELAADRRGDEGDLPVGWLHVIYWSGLRGAVSTALALSLPADLPNRAMLQGITFGVVLFTLLVQATTAELVVDRWGSKPPRPSRSRSRSKAKAKAKSKAAEPAVEPALEREPEPAVEMAVEMAVERQPEPAAEPAAGQAPSGQSSR